MKIILAAVLTMTVAGPGLAAPVKVKAAEPGEVVYREVCQACHMANARGDTGAGRIPALAGDTNLEYPDYAINVVTAGKGAMPWFRGNLTDQQIADVITYIRGHFGNRYKGVVTAAQIAELGAPAPKGMDR